MALDRTQEVASSSLASPIIEVPAIGELCAPPPPGQCISDWAPQWGSPGAGVGGASLVWGTEAGDALTADGLVQPTADAETSLGRSMARTCCPRRRGGLSSGDRRGLPRVKSRSHRGDRVSALHPNTSHLLETTDVAALPSKQKRARPAAHPRTGGHPPARVWRGGSAPPVLS